LFLWATHGQTMRGSPRASMAGGQRLPFLRVIFASFRQGPAMMSDDAEDTRSARRERWREIVFEAECPAGRRFDVILLWLICLSVLSVMLESVPEIKARYGGTLYAAEWFFTGIFTLEYFLRLYLVRHPVRY